VRRFWRVRASLRKIAFGIFIGSLVVDAFMPSACGNVGPSIEETKIGFPVTGKDVVIIQRPIIDDDACSFLYTSPLVLRYERLVPEFRGSKIMILSRIDSRRILYLLIPIVDYLEDRYLWSGGYTAKSPNAKMISWSCPKIPNIVRKSHGMPDNELNLRPKNSDICPQLALFGILRDAEDIASDPKLLIGEIRLTASEEGSNNGRQQGSAPYNQRRYIVPIATIITGIGGTFWGLWRGQASFRRHSFRAWLVHVAIVVASLVLFAGGLCLVSI
jgi:hypothetical protein